MSCSARTSWRSDAHDPEKACPGLDPGWVPVFGSGHAPRRTLPRALDRDKALAAADAGIATAGRNRAGDLVAVDPAERARLRKGLRLAVAGRDHGAAALAVGEAAVDAVAVRIVRDDEGAVFRAGD